MAPLWLREQQTLKSLVSENLPVKTTEIDEALLDDT